MICNNQVFYQRVFSTKYETICKGFLAQCCRNEMSVKYSPFRSKFDTDHELRSACHLCTLKWCIYPADDTHDTSQSDHQEACLSRCDRGNGGLSFNDCEAYADAALIIQASTCPAWLYPGDYAGIDMLSNAVEKLLVSPAHPLSSMHKYRPPGVQARRDNSAFTSRRPKTSRGRTAASPQALFGTKAKTATEQYLCIDCGYIYDGRFAALLTCAAIMPCRPVEKSWSLLRLHLSDVD